MSKYNMIALLLILVIIFTWKKHENVEKEIKKRIEEESKEEMVKIFIPIKFDKVSIGDIVKIKGRQKEKKLTIVMLDKSRAEQKVFVKYKETGTKEFCYYLTDDIHKEVLKKPSQIKLKTELK